MGPAAHARGAAAAARQRPRPRAALRVGYASPDLRFHALTRYFEPVLASHDAKQVETFCYSENGPDAVTLRLQGMAHAWRMTGGLTDAQFVQQIRDDRIDILVDLAGHTAGNRLLAFAPQAGAGPGDLAGLHQYHRPEGDRLPPD